MKVVSIASDDVGTDGIEYVRKEDNKWKRVVSEIQARNAADDPYDDFPSLFAGQRNILSPFSVPFCE